MSCNYCAGKVADTIGKRAGIPSSGTASTAHCPRCGAFLTAEGVCNNPKCPTNKQDLTYGEVWEILKKWDVKFPEEAETSFLHDISCRGSLDDPDEANEKCFDSGVTRGACPVCGGDVLSTFIEGQGTEAICENGHWLYEAPDGSLRAEEHVPGDCQDHQHAGPHGCPDCFSEELKEIEYQYGSVSPLLRRFMRWVWEDGKIIRAFHIGGSNGIVLEVEIVDFDGETLWANFDSVSGDYWLGFPDDMGQRDKNGNPDALLALVKTLADMGRVQWESEGLFPPDPDFDYEKYVGA